MDIAALPRAMVTTPSTEGTVGGQDSFSQTFSDTLKNALDIGREADRQSLLAVEGKADLTQIVNAVANADVTLQGIVAVRDKVISAYQDILRMPI
ncbi:MAG TPA: flagellar hook-basal body complex protein FliE [Dongiaceae bacterium]|jgi:flagellar hook-basal body complex protein FliE|nr:flagellar hook-basal body complex protein FliE [Dongiaceae bacterium]